MYTTVTQWFYSVSELPPHKSLSFQFRMEKGLKLFPISSQTAHLTTNLIQSWWQFLLYISTQNLFFTGDSFWTAHPGAAFWVTSHLPNRKVLWAQTRGKHTLPRCLVGSLTCQKQFPQESIIDSDLHHLWHAAIWDDLEDVKSAGPRWKSGEN